MLEHRWNPRVEVDLAAECRATGARPVPVRIRNMSLEGLFVEADQPLPRGGCLRIRFSLATGRGIVAHDVFGIIIHRTARGASLFLDVSQPVARMTLNKLAQGGLVLP